MADQALEDAMVVIQEASAALAQMSSKIQSNNDGVLAAIRDLGSKVSELENSRQPTSTAQLSKPPLYIRVSSIIIAR